MAEVAVLSSALSSLSTKDARRKLELTLTSGLTENEPCSSYCNGESNEPGSPDSGFSSDESLTPLAARGKIERSRTLPSAFRRSRSKQAAKRVRFADALGFDLERLQYFSTEHFASPFARFSQPSTAPRLVLSNFVYRSENEHCNRARASHVTVASLHASGLTVIGQVNVLNIAYDKKVLIRSTVDDWANFSEVPATFSHSVNGREGIDTFNFSIQMPVGMKTGSCQFCVCYQVNNSEFWDNNFGKNYLIEMAPEKQEITKNFPTWPSRSSTPRRNSRGRSGEESDDESMIYRPRRK